VKTRDEWNSAIPPGPVAHTRNAMGRWHPLAEHLVAVAEIGRRFGDRLGLGEFAYIAGLLHDLGKYAPAFQEYLRACQQADQGLCPRPRPGSVPHKQAGAAVAASLPGGAPAAFAIFGHHEGMPDRAALKREVVTHHAAAAALLQLGKEDCPSLASLPGLADAARRLARTPLESEMLIRMVFSCLVDADALDTEAHTDPSSSATRSRPSLSLQEMEALLVQDQHALIAAAPATPVNKIRREVYCAALKAALEPPGVFKLTVPTGGGKTRTSLAFALRHAVEHGLERVIYAIPYTSIVDQTVEVFETILGPDAVLEHHSALEPETGAPERDLWRRLACQNWDAPLIVTTTVQLFESLFSNRPGRCRKVHRLARSVIVLDEVQTLPVKLLNPLVDGLRRLVERYGSTVLLCTATQPALDRDSLVAIGFPDAREIAPDPPRLFHGLRRVMYDLSPLDDGDGWTWERVAREMRGRDACLAVLNTRKDALALLEALDDDCALHLSTLLCGRHRRDTLAEIRRRLAEGEPCRVVSTQVVECGCDLDFPLVLRALGPLDRIVQAAGRCNREGQRPVGESKVVIFRPASGGSPRGSYAVALSVANRYLHGNANLHDPAIYERYFRELYRQDDTDARRVMKLREDFDFPQVVEKLRLIEDDTVGVLVRYQEAASEYDALLADVKVTGRMTRELWRRAQPMLVSLLRREFEEHRRAGLVDTLPEAPDLYVWKGGYDPVRGLQAGAREPGEWIT